MDNLYKVDMVIVLISVFGLIFVVGYARPLVIAPLDEYESDGDVLFVIEKADVLMIDDNMDFSSSDEYAIEDGLEIGLEPGEYYWKAVGLRVSEVRKLTILSRVELRLIETEEGMGVVNTGNVKLNVDVYDGLELVDKVKLGASEYVSGECVSGECKFVGGQDG